MGSDDFPALRTRRWAPTGHLRSVPMVRRQVVGPPVCRWAPMGHHRSAQQEPFHLVRTVLHRLVQTDRCRLARVVPHSLVHQRAVRQAKGCCVPAGPRTSTGCPLPFTRGCCSRVPRLLFHGRRQRRTPRLCRVYKRLSHRRHLVSTCRQLQQLRGLHPRPQHRPLRQPSTPSKAPVCGSCTRGDPGSAVARRFDLTSLCGTQVCPR